MVDTMCFLSRSWVETSLTIEFENLYVKFLTSAHLEEIRENLSGKINCSEPHTSHRIARDFG